MKRILLIQIRDNREILGKELRSYQRIFEGRGISLERINLYGESAEFEPENAVDHFDGFIIGGSHHNVKENFPHKEKVYLLIDKIISTGKPLLGICFGFGLVVEVAGGKMENIEKHIEYGTKEIMLTEKGLKDDLFKGVPHKFMAQQGHAWSATKLGEDMKILAENENAPYQAVKLNKIPIYGLQFHPELTKKDMQSIMGNYNEEEYVGFPFEKNLIASIKETPAGEHILLNFADLI